MLPASLERILALVGEDALVLDVGGWAKPLARADWVLDLQPHATRGLYGYDGDRAAERFGADTWVVRDICAREPWPFADGQFDFAVCSHTLEDVRDPVWVCSELTRVARAGYIECPSRLEEQSYGVQGPWVGWGHHRWLVEAPAPDAIEFTFKHAVVARPGNHFPAGFADALTPEERVVTLWWEGGFGYGERVFLDGEELEAWLSEIVAARLPARRRRRRRLGRRVLR